MDIKQFECIFVVMKKIVLKSEYLELFKIERNHKSINNMNLDDLFKEMNNCLDELSLINKLIKNCNNDSINKQDYIDYLGFLENENYEEMTKYKII